MNLKTSIMVHIHQVEALVRIILLVLLAVLFAGPANAQSCNCVACDDFVVPRTSYSYFSGTCATGSYCTVAPNVANTDGSSRFIIYTMTPTNFNLYKNGQSFYYLNAGSSGGNEVTCFDAGSIYATDLTSTTLYVVIQCENPLLGGDCELEENNSWLCRSSNPTQAPTMAPTTPAPTTPNPGDDELEPSSNKIGIIVLVVIIVVGVVILIGGVITYRNCKTRSSEESQPLVTYKPSLDNVVVTR